MSPKSPARSKSSSSKRATKPAPAKAATKPAATRTARGPKAGRPMPRWSAEDVQLLLDTVAASRTAKEAFAKVASASGRSAATVQAKYYQLQRATGGAARRRPGRPAGAASSPRRSAGTSTGSLDLRAMSIDALVGHAREVKAEIDRRRRELDDATKLFK
jgi:hypothetical protein